TSSVNAGIPSARRELPISPRQGVASSVAATLRRAEHSATRHEGWHGRIYWRDKPNPSSRHQYRVATGGRLPFQCVLTRILIGTQVIDRNILGLLPFIQPIHDL